MSITLSELSKSLMKYVRDSTVSVKAIASLREPERRFVAVLIVYHCSRMSVGTASPLGENPLGDKKE